jgi:choline monooxygenase
MSDLSLQLQQAASQLPVSSYFDEALFQRELETIFQRGPRYVGHQLAVPEVGDYHALPQEGEGRALVRTPQGGRADLQRLPPPPGRDAQGPRQHTARAMPAATSCARCTAGPTAGQGELLGAPHFEQDPCLNLNNYPCANGTACCSRTTAATSPPTWPAWARAPTWTSAATCSTASSCTSATTTGRPSSRSTWRTTTSALPPRPGQLRHLRRPALGVQARVLGADRGRGQPASARPAQPVYKRWHEVLLKYRNGEPPKHGADLADLLPAHHGGVVPARADGVHAVPDGPAKDAEHGGVLLPRRDRRLRARVRRSPAGRLHGDLHRGRRDRRAHGRRPQGPDSSAATTRSAPTRARWKTACSTSTSGTAASCTTAAVASAPYPTSWRWRLPGWAARRCIAGSWSEWCSDAARPCAQG